MRALHRLALLHPSEQQGHQDERPERDEGVPNDLGLEPACVRHDLLLLLRAARGGRRLLEPALKHTHCAVADLPVNVQRVRRHANFFQ